MVGTNQFKNGMHVEVDGRVFRIVEFQHVKPGKGGAFVRTKLKRVDDGAVIDRTFRAGEKFRPVRTESRKMTFLYSDGTDAHFMDVQSYEQMAVPEESVKESLQWVVPNEEVDVLYVDDAPSRRPGPERRRAGGRRDGPRPAWRHRLRRRRQAGHPGVRRGRPGSALRQRRRPGPGGHTLGRVRLARLAWRGEASSAGPPSWPSIKRT